MDAKSTTPLQCGHFYHIYNRGINGCTIFGSNYHFRYFLFLYKKYISPIASTYSWCLLHNHFHFLVFFQEADEIVLDHKTPAHYLSQQFSNFFNAYAKYYNKVSQRHGSLFERPFKRKLVDNEDYLKKLMIYIHTNPVHHRQAVHPHAYRWSSYNEVIKKNSAFVDYISILKYFEDIENFIFVHRQKSEILILENW
ncbi:hypothetical protein MWU59_00230 [Flavobacteriaceae bacterium F08102]|nr:hypothetical protein [Flavobacteriaceae bacterium F08102]